MENLFVQLKDVAVPSCHISVITQTIHHYVSLPKDRTLQVVFFLAHTLNAALQEKEDLACRGVLSRENSHGLDAHGLKLAEEVAVEPHLSIGKQLDPHDSILIEELVNICLQMRGQDL